jgi:hypothetical protein
VRPVNRPEPTLPVEAMKTYQIRAPLPSHWFPASCEQIRCRSWVDGWLTLVDESTDLGAAQAAYIRADRTRGHDEVRQPDGLTRFVFGPGQRCFQARQHRRRLDRPEIYVVRGGDWRGNPSGTSRRHARASEWVDDFATHQQGVIEKIGRG